MVLFRESGVGREQRSKRRGGKRKEGGGEKGGKEGGSRWVLRGGRGRRRRGGGGLLLGRSGVWRNVPVLEPRLLIRAPTEKPLGARSARGRPSFFTYGRSRGGEGGEWGGDRARGGEGEVGTSRRPHVERLGAEERRFWMPVGEKWRRGERAQQQQKGGAREPNLTQCRVKAFGRHKPAGTGSRWPGLIAVPRRDDL